MAGHIAKKGNRYYVVVYGGINRTTGKGHPRLARRLRHAARRRSGLRRNRQASSTTVSTGRRIASRSPSTSTTGGCRLKQSQLSRSTFDSYRNSVRLHVAPRIGAIQLRQLQPEDLDTLYAELLIDGKLNGAGGGLAPKTVRNIHGMLRKALADAHRKGTVLRNVADLADPPKVRTGRAKDHQVWSADELRGFLSAIEDSVWFAPIYLSGEHRHATRRATRIDVAQRRPRPGASGRRPTTVVRRLRSRDRCAEDIDQPANDRPRPADGCGPPHMATGTARATDGQRDAQRRRLRVHTPRTGGPVHPDRLSKVWDQLVAEHGIRRIRLHDLRHTHASILLKANVPVKVVSERLGHSSPAFTMTVYQHVLPGMQADAAAAFGDRSVWPLSGPRNRLGLPVVAFKVDWPRRVRHPASKIFR
jgi:integrase